MVPTVLERSSWIDRERPIRLYRFDDKDKHKTIRLTYKMGSNDYWGVQESNWEDAPVLGSRNFVRNIGGRRYELFYNGPHLHMVVLNRKGATYWVVNTLLDRLSNETMLAIAKGLRPINKVPRPSQLVGAAPHGRGRVRSDRRERLPSTRRRLRCRLRRPRHRRLLRRARPLGRRPRRAPRADRGAAARRGADLRARARGADRAERRAAHASRRDVGEAIDGADFVYIAVGTPPTYSGDADLSAVWTVIDELPAIDRRCVVVMKSTVPVGTGLKVRHRLDERGLDAGRLRLEPRVHRRGNRGQGLPPPRPDRRRRVPRRGRRRRRGAARGHRGPGRALRRRLGGDDQAGGQRRADDADLVHQRDRERLRGDRRRRRARRRGHRPRPPDRPELPAGRDRLRRLLLPQGLAGAEAIGSELGLPLPAAQRRDRGERAAEAPRDRQAPQPPRLAARTSASRCSGSRSSRTPTTCARRRASSSRAGCSPRAPTCVAWDPVVDGHDLHGVEIADTPGGGGASAPTRS